MAEGQICPDCGEIRFRNKCRLTEIALPFPVFALSEVTSTLFPANNLTGSGNFEPFGDTFTGLCFACSSGHGARILGGSAGSANGKLILLVPGSSRFRYEGPADSTLRILSVRL